MAKKIVTNRGMKKPVVAKKKYNKAEALSKVRDAASEFHAKLFDLSGELDISYEDVMDVAQEELEGANIPEEPSEEIRKRAKRQGKTFVQVVLELVELGLAVSPRHIKKFKEYSEITSIPLNKVFDECLGEYEYCTIQTRYECMAERAEQS